MATPLRPVAKCVLRWLYEQVSELLRMLKEALLKLIALIDAQIAKLRAILAQGDVVANALRAWWAFVSGLIEELKNSMLGLVDSDAVEACPELIQYFVEPFVGLLEQFLSAFQFVGEDLFSLLSYMDEVDRAILYWENTKLDLIAAIDIIDAAILNALMSEASQVP